MDRDACEQRVKGLGRPSNPKIEEEDARQVRGSTRPLVGSSGKLSATSKHFVTQIAGRLICFQGQNVDQASHHQVAERVAERALSPFLLLT